MSCYIKSLKELDYKKDEDLVKKYISEPVFTKLQSGYKKLAEKDRDQAELFDTRFRLWIASICSIKENLKPSSLNFAQWARTLHTRENAQSLKQAIAKYASDLEEAHLELMLSVLKASPHVGGLLRSIGLTDSYYNQVQNLILDVKRGLLDSLSSARKMVDKRHNELEKENSLRTSAALKSRLNALTRRGGKHKRKHKQTRRA
jgi:hypothetical protein